MVTDSLVGQILNQYELREMLGRGGMGSVYRAYQHSLSRTVAVKVLSPELIIKPEHAERFDREAMTSAQLEHPNIVKVYDYGHAQGMSYLVMQLLTGGTLNERLKRQTTSGPGLPALGEVARLLKQIASALDYAHSRGVIHRDVKPSNVMFDNHRNAYLVDFGIAKLVDTSSMLTNPGQIVGTVGYMAPEQWRNEELTPAADQYALGVMIYLLITGQMPFEANSMPGMMYKHLNDLPTPPHLLRPEVPEAVTAVLERALAKTPAERFPTCTAFALAFWKSIQGCVGQPTGFFAAPSKTSQVPAPPEPPSLRVAPVRPFYQLPLFWGLSAVITILLAAVVTLVIVMSGQTGENAKAQAADRLTTGQTATPDTSAPAGALTSTADPGGAQVATAPMASETPTVTPSPTLSSTPSPTLSPTATLSPSATITFTPSATLTPSPTNTLPPRSPTPTRTLTPTATIGVPVITVAVEGANLRNGPGTSYDVIGKAGQGESFPIIAQAYDNTWYLIAAGSGVYAWIAASVGNLPAGIAPIPAAPTIPPLPTAIPLPTATPAPVQSGTGFLTVLNSNVWYSGQMVYLTLSLAGVPPAVPPWDHFAYVFPITAQGGQADGSYNIHIDYDRNGGWRLQVNKIWSEVVGSPDSGKGTVIPIAPISAPVSTELSYSFSGSYIGSPQQIQTGNVQTSFVPRMASITYGNY